MTVEFRCRDVGVSCRGVVKADTAEELIHKVKEHAEKAHGVELTQTLIDYAATTVKEGS